MTKAHWLAQALEVGTIGTGLAHGAVQNAADKKPREPRVPVLDSATAFSELSTSCFYLKAAHVPKTLPCVQDPWRLSSPPPVPEHNPANSTMTCYGCKLDSKASSFPKLLTSFGRPLPSANET